MRQRNEIVFQQIFRRVGPHAGFQIRGRRHENHRDARKRARNQLIGGQHERQQDAEIVAFFDQKLLLESGYQPYEHIDGRGCMRNEPEHARRLADAVPRFRLQCIQLRENPRAPGEKALGDFGSRDMAGRTLEKPHAQLLFEIVHRTRNSRRRQAMHLRGTGKTPDFDHSAKDT